MNAAVLETIKKSAAVPSMPQVVLRFLEIMQDPGFEYRDLVRVLSADAGTVSEVLRLANSALFGVRNKVVSLQQALTLLGPKRVRSLLLGRYLVDSMSRLALDNMDMGYFWRRSLISSVVASQFAGRILPNRRDEASIGALLADIGVPILAETFPEKYAPILTDYAPHGRMVTAEEEIASVDVSHAQVSAMVLAHWRLPEDVTNAVNMHQSEAACAGDVATTARLLHSSDRIAKILCEVPEPELAASECFRACAWVGVDVGLLIQLLPTIENDIEELAQALRIDVLASNAYTIIAEILQERLTATLAN